MPAIDHQHTCNNKVKGMEVMFAMRKGCLWRQPAHFFVERAMADVQTAFQQFLVQAGKQRRVVCHLCVTDAFHACRCVGVCGRGIAGSLIADD